jgi:thiamine-monophosphate kinase
MTELLVSGISEFELIDRLRNALPANARGGDRVDLAIGDDAAVARITPGERLVISTDTLNDGIHFRLDWTSWADLGHKALAVNLSDLAAMGARPVLATVNLGLTGSERVRDLEEMYRGIGALARAVGAVIAGGDVTRSPAALSITVTAIGETVGGDVMRRDAGQPGDEIWVTGSIGAAAAGLRLLQLDTGDPRRSAATAGLLIQALHRPEPPVAAGLALLGAGVRCAMDLSDGLSGDLRKIVAASKVDAEIHLAQIPVPASARAIFRDQAIEFAITGGDDYELLFTAPRSLATEIEQALRSVGINGAVIGQLTERAGTSPVLTAISTDGHRSVISAHGFDHFRRV